LEKGLFKDRGFVVLGHAVMQIQEHEMAVAPQDALIQAHAVQASHALCLAFSPLPRAPMGWYLVY